MTEISQWEQGIKMNAEYTSAEAIIAAATAGTRRASSLINRHLMEHGDPEGLLAGAIEILDHEIGLPCPVCTHQELPVVEP